MNVLDKSLGDVQTSSSVRRRAQVTDAVKSVPCAFASLPGGLFASLPVPIIGGSPLANVHAALSGHQLCHPTTWQTVSVVKSTPLGPDVPPALHLACLTWRCNTDEPPGARLPAATVDAYELRQ